MINAESLTKVVNSITDAEVRRRIIRVLQQYDPRGAYFIDRRGYLVIAR